MHCKDKGKLAIFTVIFRFSGYFKPLEVSYLLKITFKYS